MSPLEKVTLWNRYGYEAIFGNTDADEVEAEHEDPDYEFGREGFEQFVRNHDFLGQNFLTDPNEAFYHSIELMSVWQRISDLKCFGYPYHKMVHKHGDWFIESNGDSHGIDWQDPRGEAFVFVEVEPFTITGYKIDN
jgi:hypothetical protein